MEALRRRQGTHPGGRWGATPARRLILRRALARITVLAGGLAVAAAMGLGAISRPAAVNAAGPLPPCRYDDILTTPRQYTDWSVTLVDTILRVTKGYVPPDLVPVSQAGIPGNGQVRAVVIDDLRAMSEAAAGAKAAIGVQSAYRSFKTQRQVFNGVVEDHGYRRALQLSARPGHSEHQLGLGIDFRSHPGGSPFNGTTWASTPAGKWMKRHGWEYGFVMSYPRGKMSVACYDFEPWHYRYVGRELAGEIHASGLTPREYLWANFTTTIVPAVTPGPGVTAKPTKAPTIAPSVGATGSAAASSLSTRSAPPPTRAATLPPTAGPPSTPRGTPLGVDPGSVGGVGPGVVAGLGIALVGGIVLGWMVLRGGRSSVGL